MAAQAKKVPQLKAEVEDLKLQQGMTVALHKVTFLELSCVSRQEQGQLLLVGFMLIFQHSFQQ